MIGSMKELFCLMMTCAQMRTNGSHNEIWKNDRHSQRNRLSKHGVIKDDSNSEERQREELCWELELQKLIQTMIGSQESIITNVGDLFLFLSLLLPSPPLARLLESSLIEWKKMEKVIREGMHSREIHGMRRRRRRRRRRIIITTKESGGRADWQQRVKDATLLRKGSTSAATIGRNNKRKKKWSSSSFAAYQTASRTGYWFHSIFSPHHHPLHPLSLSLSSCLSSSSSSSSQH